MIKRGLRRNILIGVSAIALSFMFVSTWGVSVHASEASREITVSEEGIDPHSEMIERSMCSLRMMSIITM